MKTSIFKNFNLKNRITTSILVFLFCTVAILYFFVLPTIKDIEQMGIEIEKQKLDLEEKYQKGQSLRKLAEDLQKIEPLTNQLDDIYIKKENSLDLITDLEKIASTNRISQKINLVSLDKNNEQYYQKIPIQLFNTGNFINQVNYLEAIELLKYYINIQSLEISTPPQGAKNSDNSVNMLIFADTYWH